MSQPLLASFWLLLLLSLTIDDELLNGSQSVVLQISGSSRIFNPDYSLEGLMLSLKLQYFGHLLWRAKSWEKTLLLRKTEVKGEEGGRGWDGLIASLTQWTWVWANPGDSEGQGSLVCCSTWGCKESDTT